MTYQVVLAHGYRVDEMMCPASTGNRKGAEKVAAQLSHKGTDKMAVDQLSDSRYPRRTLFAAWLGSYCS